MIVYVLFEDTARHGKLIKGVVLNEEQAKQVCEYNRTASPPSDLSYRAYDTDEFNLLFKGEKPYRVCFRENDIPIVFNVPCTNFVPNRVFKHEWIFDVDVYARDEKHAIELANKLLTAHKSK